ncbi:hypothetical protein Taro_026534 [Colocasia esculenta]|uniref:O-fucosyltransferase family protein n=1 Tax=Colocasia esculenta TaxID=4460 RepID=A0A843VNV7_COLES|nr:hypothetical protein [Colocasia esculenta]
MAAASGFSATVSGAGQGGSRSFPPRGLAAGLRLLLNFRCPLAQSFWGGLPPLRRGIGSGRRHSGRGVIQGDQCFCPQVAQDVYRRSDGVSEGQVYQLLLYELDAIRKALRFSNPISTLTESLVSRMRKLSTDNERRYVAVHLRFEEDMVAFSCCIFDGGEKDMSDARERGWRGKFTKPGRVIRPGAIRMNGKCPLTPLEIYEAEKTMKSLLEMFPCLQTKETLASAEELAPFKVHRLLHYGIENYSSKMAAIDYTAIPIWRTCKDNHRRYLIGPVL